ncbi:MAG: DUF2299 family protein [Promethearchaeota archaeon]
MAVKESKLKHNIREFLLDEGILRGNIKDNKLDFGFQFTFPPGPGGQNMAVFKPKGKDLIIISLGTQISPPHVEALNALGDKQMNFFIDLRKFLLLRNMLFRIDIKNYRYEISEQIFIDEEKLISKNRFFKYIRKVFSSAAYANMILSEYCEGRVKFSPDKKAKDLSSSTDFSLYL